MKEFKTYYFIAGVPHEGNEQPWVKRSDAEALSIEAKTKIKNLSAEIKRLKTDQSCRKMIEYMDKRIQSLKQFEGNKPAAVAFEKFMQKARGMAETCGIEEIKK